MLMDQYVRLPVHACVRECDICALRWVRACALCMNECMMCAHVRALVTLGIDMHACTVHSAYITECMCACSVGCAVCTLAVILRFDSSVIGRQTAVHSCWPVPPLLTR